MTPFPNHGLIQLQEGYQEDGLYINDTWVCNPLAALTFQANDLTKPDSLQSSYSKSIYIPDTLAMFGITEGGHHPNSGSDVPYQTLPAYLVASGEVVFRGRFELAEFNRGWRGNLLQEKRSLLEALRRPLRSFGLSGYDFRWNVDTINAQKNATAGVCFPLIDAGTLTATEQPSDVLTPAFYVHTLIDEILKQEGYKLVGSMRDDELYKRLVLPFVEEKATNADSDFIEARKARVATLPGDTGPTKAQNRNITLDYKTDNYPAQGFAQGKLKLFNTANSAYVPDANMRVRVTAFQQFMVTVFAVGAVEAKLQVEKNGVVVAESSQTFSENYNPLQVQTDALEIDTLIDCQKGDVLRIRFSLEKRTKVAVWRGKVLFGPQQSNAGFEPDNTLLFGDQWPVSRNLPDLTGLEVLKSVALMTGSMFAVNEMRREFRFVKLSDVANNTANAVDWSDRTSSDAPPTITPQLSPYTQNNRLCWKECEGVDKGFGDGLINARSTNPDEVTLFTLPFAATMQSSTELSGYGKPLNIPTRSVSSNGEVTRKRTEPRMILVEPQHSYMINTTVLNESGKLQKQTVELMACWFNNRPPMAAAVNNSLSLDFTDSAQHKGLISRYFKEGLGRVLRRPRMIEIVMQLQPSDIADLDFSRPVRIHGVQVGTLDFSEGWYWLNKISDYVPGRPCNVTLVSF